MNKSIKHIFMISFLLLVMVGVVSTASAASTHDYDNATAFLDNITQLENNSVVTINCSQANVSQNYTINASNITIKAINGQVTFQSNTSNIHFIINGNNVTLQGITFQNFNGTFNGGTILWNGDNGTITNCNFNNNTATENGGAIYLQGNKKKWNMDNCTFKNNTAKSGSGGAIYNRGGNVNIKLCNFTNNTAKSGSGGAIYFTTLGGITNLIITQCNFTNNTAKSGSGGAIYFTTLGGITNLIITQCNFTNNTAKSGGGAIYWGGNDNSGMGNIIQCRFANNTAQTGGAIHNQGGNVNIKLCNFTNNTADYDGGAIYFTTQGGTTNSIITQCNFTNNTAKRNGGAIYWGGYPNLSITFNNFINNTAKRNGGAIYISRDNFKIINCNFTNNTATENGGAIYITGSSKVTMINSTLSQNQANQHGGAMHINSGIATITNSTIHNNNNYDIYNVATLTVEGGNGGIIYNTGTINNTLNVIILGNKTVGVAEDDDFNLTAFIKVGNYTIIGPQAFNFTINNDNFTANLTGDYYATNYHVTGAVGDIIPVNGSYAYTKSAVNYQTGRLLIKNSVVITGNNVTFPYNNKIEVNLNVTTSNGTLVDNGTVAVAIDGKTYTGKVSNGKATIEISDKVDAGVYYLTAVYEENYDYLNATFDFILNITKINSMVGITVDDVNYGETAIVKIATIPEMTGNLTLVINGKPHSISTDSKQYIISDVLDAGTYSVYAYYVGDNNFKFNDNLTSFTVKPIATHTNVTVDNSTVDKVVLYINASDIYNNPVNGTAIATVKDYGAYYGIIINGLGEIVIPNLPTGEYFADIVFTSTSNYKQSSTNCSFKTTSAPIEYNLTATNVYKEFENATQYHAILKDNNGNPLANKTISIAISSSKWSKDVYYRITTDNDGLATLTINLLPGSYIIRADYGDEIAINNITVIASNLKLHADNLVKYFMNGSQYTVKVTDVNGNPVANRTVTIAINKASWKSPVKYYVKTNADGIATLDINLIAGSYSVTANICYNSTKSSITVLPTLTAESITKKVNKAGSLKAKLVDGQGNPAIGKEVTFTVGYNTYTFTTDYDGIATLPIHLHAGTWSVLVACPETGASTRATVKVIK